MKTPTAALLALALCAPARAALLGDPLALGFFQLKASTQRFSKNRARQQQALREWQAAWVDIVRDARRSVVTLRVEVHAKMPPGAPIPDVLADMLGVPRVDPGVLQPDGTVDRKIGDGSGTAFIVGKDEEGRPLLATNAHVVQSVGRNGKIKINNVEAEITQTKVTATFADGREVPATVLDFNRAADLGLVRLDQPCPTCKALRLGDSSKVEPAQWVVAIGAPFGYGDSVTGGMVSALKRPGGPTGYADDFIQHNAGIGPGNSGGPLINIAGEVIGVNTAIFSPLPQPVPVGIGFACPIHYLKELLARRKATGSMNFVRAGITLVEKDGGIELAAVGGNAQAAGLQVGDVIVSADGRRFARAIELSHYLANKLPGQQTDFTVARGGRIQAYAVTMTPMD